jgi:hypothetical protein
VEKSFFGPVFAGQTRRDWIIIALKNMPAEEEKIIQGCAEKLRAGTVPSWKIEDEIVTYEGVEPPAQFRLAALARQRFLEGETGERFQYIHIPEKPYKAFYFCESEKLGYELEARDSHHNCLFCEGKLRPLEQFAPLVANYVGGSEAYYSFAGRIRVRGDVEKNFSNLLVYGTGLGPIGVTRGSYLINNFGGARVQVSELARAVRSLAFLFRSEETRKKAVRVIEDEWPQLRTEMDEKITEFGGHMVSVEFGYVENQQGYILYVEFATDFRNFRGHGDTSRVVGYAKGQIEASLKKNHIDYDLGIIAQGYDGDLKPSPRNKRGRYAMAEVRVPGKEFEESFGLDAKKFLASVEVDRIGANKLGCQFYSGMGGEIIPAVYKATRVNPQSSLVSSFQNIVTRIDKGELVFGVELPNIEVGVASTREGIIPPSGREALRIMGVQTAREFAASLAAQVLAGEFNLALEISRQKLYSPG